MSVTKEEMEDLILIGMVRKVRGTKGDLKVESYSDVRGRFVGMKSAYFRSPGKEQPVRHSIEKCEEMNGYVVMKPEGVNSFDEASNFIGSEILVREDERAQLPKGTFYVDSLVGMSVVEEGGRSIGVVEEIVSNGAQSLLSIRQDDGAEVSVPFVKPFLVSIDLEERSILIRLIDGMLGGGLDED